MMGEGTLLALAVVAVALSALAAAYTFLTRRSDWPGLALQSLQETALRLEALEQSWRTYKIGLDETLEAMDELRARTETARKRTVASETRQRGRGLVVDQEEPQMTPAQEANARWRQHKAGR